MAHPLVRRVAGLALASLLLASVPAAAEVLRRFDVDLYLERDGSFAVEETLLYDFEGVSRHGIFRELPLDRGRSWLEELPIRLEVESVADASGRSRPYRESGGASARRIRIGDPDRFVQGVETYRLRYRVHRAIQFLEAHDELYWNATGHEWSVPIDAVRVSVYLPEGVRAADVNTRCFTGPPGSTASRCRVETRNESLAFESETPLGRGAGMTVAVALPKGVLVEPGPFARAVERLRDLGGPWLLAPFASLAGMLAFWRRRGRDPDVAVAVPVHYEPPAGLTPAEVGTLLDERADLDDVTSTVLDLAVRGWLRLEEVESESFLFFANKDWRLVRLRADEEGLKRHERLMLSGLFSSGETVLLSSLKTTFHDRLGQIVDALYRDLSGPESHFVDSPRTVRRRWLLIAAGVAGLALVGGVTETVRIPVAILGGLSAGVIALFARAMPRRTRRGRRALEQVLGFREFVARVDADRLEREGLRAPKQFERLLPYAIVLGVADHWAELFADLYSQPPDWYRSAGGVFDAHDFVGDLGQSIHTMGRTLSATPPSQGSAFSVGGGFGGGGFSGGGFGGGGGGSW